MLEKRRKERENVNGKRNSEMLKKIFVLDFVYITSLRVNSYDTYCIFKNYSMQTKIINEYRVSFFFFNMVVTVYLFQSLIKSKVFPQMHKDVNCIV